MKDRVVGEESEGKSWKSETKGCCANNRISKEYRIKDTSIHLLHWQHL